MAILITGGSGFIGSHFHNYIKEEKIVNLDLVEPAFNYSSEYVKGDIRIEEDVRRAIRGKGIDKIISLAAKHHDFGIGHDEYFDTNEDGTSVLCKVASEFGISKIVFFSSVAVYGIRNEVSTENMNPAPDSPYGASKLAGEKVLIEWVAQDASRQLVIIRPTVVFGPNNLANMYSLIKQIDSGYYFHLGEAANVKSIAYVENVVNATLYLLDRVKPGMAVYNYADEPQLSSREIGDTIATSLGKRIRFTLPVICGLMAALPFDVLIKLTGKNLPISTARIRKLGTETMHSGRKIFNEGFKPNYTTIQGLKKMVSWYMTDVRK